MVEVSPSTIEHDIAELERKLEEKKAALGHEKSEKEILHEVVGEKIQEHVPTYTPSSPGSVQSIPKTTEQPSYLTQELKDKIDRIVQIIFDKNLEEGIKEAAKTGNIALIDALHAILTDELYDRLIEKKKLEKVE